MRARFLLGPAGSGKTFRCLAEIRARLKADPLGPPLILLAPRQATYQLELELLAQPDLVGYTRLQIVSFERFAAWVLDRLGVHSREMLSEEGRVMVLRALLHQHHEQLKVFRQSSRSTGFAQLLSRQLQELQQHRVSPAALRAAAERVAPATGLADKLVDLALLLEKYLAWLTDQKLPDAGTLLDLAVRSLNAASHAGNPQQLHIEALWLDGMAELTPQELEFLAALTPFCGEATLAFCLEAEPKDELPWLSTWSVISQTFRRCHAVFTALPNCEVSVEVLARDNERNRFSKLGEFTKDPGGDVLRQLEANWTAGTSSNLDALTVRNELDLIKCPDPEHEAVMAAREILKFVQAGHRFRDCAVLLRQMDTHYAGLRRVFTRYQIPFFLDRRESVAHHPLAEFTRSALHTVLFNWRFTDWFAVLKSGLTSLHADEVDRLENHALARGWEGGQWLRPLELPDAPALARDCEALRRRVIAPFERMRETLGVEPSGRQLAEAIRRLWDDFEVENTLEDWAATSPTEATHLTVLEELTGWLENLERAFGDFKLPLREWLPILEAGLSTLTVGVIPPAIDQVLIGAVDRSRNPDLKLAVVLGLNEGLFPQPPDSLSLLTEADRSTLETATLNLRNDARQRLGHERYLGYIAFTRARERVILSWSQSDAAGTVLNVSPLVDHVQRLFPNAEVRTFHPQSALTDCVHASELLGTLARSMALEQSGKVEPVTPRVSPDVLTAVAPDSNLTDWLAHFSACNSSYRSSRLSPATAAQLYGSRLRTSASRLEQFAACPFQFFANAGLRARERDRFEVDARKTGTFMHEVLRQFHEELAAQGARWRDVTPEEARKRIARIAREQLSRVADGVLASHPRHIFRAENLTALLQEFVAAVINWMQTYQFDPIAVELGIGASDGGVGQLPWWEIDLGDGRTLAFRGSVDRVDAAAIPGRNDAVCLTVMDYKSGNKTFEKLKMQAGLQLQLPAYLAALCEVASGSTLLGGKQAVAAGMFYVRLKDASESTSHRDAEPDPKAGKRFAHSGRFSFERLALFDSANAMGSSGQFSYRLKKDGEPYGNSHQLVRQPELDGLLADAKAMLRAMGQDILSGNISVDPYRKGTEIPCTYCDLKPVCRIDPWTHTYRPLKPILGGEVRAASEVET